MPRERRVGSTPTSPTTGRSRRSGPPPAPSGVRRLYFPAMQVTTTPAPKSTILLEIELPAGAPRQRRSGDAVRHLSRRTRVPGFRPGKAPRPVLERALGPGRRPRRGGRAPRPGRLSRGARRAGHPAADQRRRRGRPGRGGQAAASSRRPSRSGPEVKLGDYQQLQLRAGDRDHRRRPGRQGHRGAARPERDADGGRGPRREGRRLRGHRLRRDARRRAVRGRHARSGCR